MIKIEDLNCLEDNINSIYNKYSLTKDRRLIKKQAKKIKIKKKIIQEGYTAMNDGRKKNVKLKVLNEIKKSLDSNKKECLATYDIEVLDEKKKKNLELNKKEIIKTDNIKVSVVLKEFLISKPALNLLLENKFKIDFKNHVTKTKTGLVIAKEFYLEIKDLLEKEYIEKYIEIEDLLATLGAKESITVRRLIENLNIKINNNIDLYKGNKYVKKAFIKVIKTEANDFSEEYLKFEDKYIHKVNLNYVLEKYTLNRRELENISLEYLNCNLKDHLINLRGVLFLKKSFILKLKQNIDDYLKNNKTQLANLSPWKSFSKRYGITYSKLIDICKNDLNIEADKEIYYIYKNVYINKSLLESVKRIIEETHNKNSTHNGRYTDIRDLTEVFMVSEDLLRKTVLEYKDRCFINKGIFYMQNTFIKEIQHILNKTVDIIEISEKHDISRQLIIKVCKIEGLELIKNPFGFNRYRININDVKNVIISKIVSKFNNQRSNQSIQLVAKDELEYYKMMVEKLHINDNLIKTSKLFNSFAIQRITNINGKNSRRYIIARKCCSIMELLNDYLNKELFNCTNEDVLYLISKSPEGSESKILRGFIEYCRSSTVCEFTSPFTCSELKKDEGNDEDDIYSKDEWGKITRHLTNIDIHILKAFDDQKYSCLWLLGLLHLVTIWRINDMVTKIPSIDIELIGINDFEWFEDRNEFSLSMAQSVLRSLELKLSGVNADKNNQQLRFFYSIELAVPLAICYVIAEIHRRKNNNDKVLSRLLSNKFKEEIAPWVCVNGFEKLFMQTETSKFSNLKANRTLMTYMYEVANEIEGNHSISYMLCGSMRSHKIDSHIQLPIATRIYLKPIINSEDAKAISYNLLKRGFFGWIPYKLLEIAYSDKNKIRDLEMKEVTEMISTLRADYGLLGLEALAKYFNFESYQKNNIKVFNELVKLEKSQLKEIIRKLLTNESTSKHPYGGCLKGNKCAYPNKDTCIFCEYFVKNVYFLYYVNEEINRVLEKILKINEAQRFDLIKQNKILFNLLGIVTEAKTFYCNYDSKFVDTFIDINVIKEKIKKIQHKLISL